MRKCYLCKTEKPDEDFYKDKSRKSGYGTKCKDCAKKYVKLIRPFDADTKGCPQCGEILAIAAFDKSSSGDGYQTACRDCRKDIKARWEENNRHRRFFIQLKTKYNLSQERYEELYSLQGGSCAICMVPFFAGANEVPHVDHDHACCPGRKSCGKCIRGLLCKACNTGLGNFKDDQRLLGFAQLYLSDKGKQGWEGRPHPKPLLVINENGSYLQSRYRAE
jgi:hypothetical protein